jgi:hypothetical protein
MVVGMLAVVWNMNSTASVEPIARSSEPVQKQSPVVQQASNNEPILASVPSSDPKQPAVERTNLSDEQLKKTIRANFVERGPRTPNAIPASAQYLPGEESYIRTIGDLQQGVTVQNASLSASNQVSFARDMAVVDDSIKKMRDVVRKNPRNQAAKQVLYSSYQDKIDLLRSSAQSNELMASLQ